MELGFNMGIPGITKPSVTGVNTTQISKAPAQVKQSITQQINKPANTTTTGRISPKTSDDDAMVLAAIDILQEQKSGDDIVKSYSSKMSENSFNNTISILRDISQGSGLNEIISAYPDVTKDVISDIYTAHKTVKQPEESDDEPGVIKNFISGVAGQIPKMVTNTLSLIAKKPNGIYQRGEEIAALVKGEESPSEKKSESIKNLGNRAQQEIVNFIGGDEETKSYKVGQIAAEIAPFFVTPALGGEEFGAKITEKITSTVLKKMPNLTKLISNPLVQRVLQRGISSIPATEATTIMGQGKLASPKELGIGAATNIILPGGAMSKSNKLTKTIGEQQTSQAIEAGQKIGNIEDVSALKKMWSGLKIKVNPSKKATEAINTIKQDMPDFSVKPVELQNQLRGKMVNGKRVGGKINEISAQYGDTLSQVNISTATKNKAEIVNKLNTLLEDASTDLTPSVIKSSKKLIKNIQNAKTMKDVWEANKKFNELLPDTMKSGLASTSRDKVIYKSRKPIQEDINNFIDTVSSEQGIQGTAETRKKLADYIFADKQLSKNMKILSKESVGLKDVLRRGTSTVAKLWILGKVLGNAGVDKKGIAEY